MGMKSYGLGAKSEPITPTAPTAPAPAVAPPLSATEVGRLIDRMSGMSPAKMWETQSNVRVAVDFLARNVGQIGVHVFERDANGSRTRSTASNTARALARPNPGMTEFELKRALVADLCLHDEAWWLTAQTAKGWVIRPLPAVAVTVVDGDEMSGDLRIRYAGSRGSQIIEQKNLIHFPGFRPDGGAGGISVIESLRDTLTEQVAAAAFRKAMWRNGGQMSTYIQRPKDAPAWQEGGRNRFLEGLRAFRLGGAKQGGTLLLEDGMSVQQNRFNAKEEQWLEAAKLSLETVARAFHINPTMLGATGGVSYANVKEFRSMLYTETLGPILAQIEDRINGHLVPRLDGDADLYAEFNVKAKLAASFDEQAAVLSAAVGRPWMTADEARALDNRPALGGDAAQLVTPLNVLVGGQASPRDSAPKADMTVSTKAADEPVERTLSPSLSDESSDIMRDTLTGFFKRQRRSVLSKLPAKADRDWWDEERWNKELAADLLRSATKVTQQVAEDALEAAGLEPGDYSVARTTAFLTAVSASRARWINGATKQRLEDVLAAADSDDEDAEAPTPESVFDEAESSRGDQVAKTLLTTFAAFATVEAATQNASGGAVKTWISNSSNPRSEHAAMSGESVPLGETFSNGAQWPGDPVLGAEGVANCECTVEITFS